MIVSDRQMAALSALLWSMIMLFSVYSGYVVLEILGHPIMPSLLWLVGISVIIPIAIVLLNNQYWHIGDNILAAMHFIGCSSGYTAWLVLGTPILDNLMKVFFFLILVVVTGVAEWFLLHLAKGELS
jgi:hypothetical protein